METRDWTSHQLPSTEGQQGAVCSLQHPQCSGLQGHTAGAVPLHLNERVTLHSIPTHTPAFSLQRLQLTAHVQAI